MFLSCREETENTVGCVLDKIIALNLRKDILSLQDSMKLNQF